MSETYTKLFQSILRSSIWLEDDQTLRVWVAMLALADQHGYVGASVGGLASQARVSKEKVQEALDKFLAPDSDSRSPEYEGRRIEVAERGWNLLNYQRFRDMRDEDARRQYERDRKREQRSRKSPTVPASPGLSGLVPECHEMSAQGRSRSEAEASTDSHDAEGETVFDPVAAAQAKAAKAARPVKSLPFAMYAEWLPEPGQVDAFAEKHGVPREKILAQVKEFAWYWQEKGKRRNAAGWSRAFGLRIDQQAERGFLYSGGAQRGGPKTARAADGQEMELIP